MPCWMPCRPRSARRPARPIGATALYKLSNLVAGFPGALHYAHQIRFLAHVEVTVAAVVILYVAALYAKNLRGMLPKLPAAT